MLQCFICIWESVCVVVYCVVSLKDSVSQRAVSDLSVAGVGENEKQMLEPCAGAVCSLCHTNTLDPNCSGWSQERLGQDKLVFVQKKIIRERALMP